MCSIYGPRALQLPKGLAAYSKKFQVTRATSYTGLVKGFYLQQQKKRGLNQIYLKKIKNGLTSHQVNGERNLE